MMIFLLVKAVCIFHNLKLVFSVVSILLTINSNYLQATSFRDLSLVEYIAYYVFMRIELKSAPCIAHLLCKHIWNMKAMCVEYISFIL